MCGIAGIIRHDGLTEAEVRALPAMLDRLVHRGPDDSGRHVTDGVALGHRRLRVIDLETGHQPIANETQTVWTVVNGEFYNFLELRDDLIARGHVFRSAGDSECLVHLYEEKGDRCIESLDGMFAFALWDARQQTALLARDRLGVKPLYYHFDGRRLVFGSELKALLAVPGVPMEVDPTALIDYLTFGFIPAPKTIFRNIHKLPAGSLLKFRRGRLSVERYWDLAHRGWRTDPLDALADELWSRLKRATRPRLIADVPVGAFLSGGLDSSAVVAAMARLARNDIITLTCGFDEQTYDERPYAREVASLLHTDHHEALIRTDAAGIVDELCYHFDEPFADPSAIPTYYLSRQIRRRVTVALSGDGGDEVMAGYRRYRFDRYEQAFRRVVPGILRRAVIGPIASAYPDRPWMPRVLRAASTLRNLTRDPATAHGLSISTMPPAEARLLLDRSIAQDTAGYDPLDHVRSLYRRCDAPDHMSKCQYVDIRLGLADGILTKVDRASMAHALEVRSPMLDHRFVEFAWSIPPGRRIRGTAGKFPLRRAVQRHLGCSAPLRPKAGFDVPLDDWFAGPLRERFLDGLTGPGAKLHEWISPEAIGRTWQDHASGRRLCGPTLWKLTMFDSWCRRFMQWHRRPAGGGESTMAACSPSAPQSAIPNPQSPIPNPQSPVPNPPCTH
jgi:asparagine synthase (glutamine-hydrolysing)